MADIVKLLEDIDEVSNGLLCNEEDVYNNILDMTEDIGGMLEKCAGETEKINQMGYNISEEDIFSIVECYGEALTNKDNMMMLDLLCFEIYPLINTYKMALEG